MKEKENDIKKMIQQSSINTSHDFTDRLMHRIQTETIEQEIKVWNWKPVVAVLTSIMIIVSMALYFTLENAFAIVDIKVPVARTPIIVVVSLVFLLTLQYIRSLYSIYNSILKS